MKPRLAVQGVVFGFLGPIGRARGLKATYPEYLGSYVVEPGPGALASIDAGGYLMRGST